MQGCRVLCFGDEWFFADHYLQQGVVLGSIFLPIIIGRSLFPAGSYVLGRFFLLVFCGRIFLGPTGQEAKEKTVIIYGIAVTASQFLAIVYFR